MNLDEAIHVSVLSAVRAALPELLAELQRPRLIPIRELPVSFRMVLAAEKAGEIQVYRKGKFSAVDEAEFVAWVKRVAKPSAADEIADLVDSNRRRHRQRAAHAV
jgi:hypothetical protein